MFGLGGGGMDLAGQANIRIQAITQGLRQQARAGIRGVSQELHAGAAEANAAAGGYKAAFGIIKAGAIGVGVGIVGALAMGAGAAIAYEKAFAGVIKTVGGTATQEQLDHLRKRFVELSKEIPLSAVEFAALGEAAGALGVHTEDIEDFARVTALLGATTNVTSDQAATALGQLSNVLHLTAQDYNRFGSTLVDLGNKGASTESQILDIASRSGAAGRLIGLTTPQILGFASAIANMGIEVEAGGSALQILYVKMIQLINDPAGLKVLAKTAGVSGAAFKKAFQEDAAGALTTFFRGLGQFDASGQTEILDQLGLSGIRTTRAFLGMAGTVDNNVIPALDNANAAWEKNNALQIVSAARFNTTSVKLAILGNTINANMIELGDNLLPGILDALIWLTNQIPIMFGAIANVWNTILAPAFSQLGGAIGRLLGSVGEIIGGGQRGVDVGKAIQTGFETAAGVVAAVVRGVSDVVDLIASLAGNQVIQNIARFVGALVAIKVAARLARDAFGGLLGLAGRNPLGGIAGSLGYGTKAGVTGAATGAQAEVQAAGALDGAATALKAAAAALEGAAGVMAGRGAAGMLGPGGVLRGTGRTPVLGGGTVLPGMASLANTQAIARAEAAAAQAGQVIVQRTALATAAGVMQAGKNVLGAGASAISGGMRALGAGVSVVGRLFWPAMLVSIGAELLAEPIGGFVAGALGKVNLGAQLKKDLFGGIATWISAGISGVDVETIANLDTSSFKAGPLKVTTVEAAKLGFTRSQMEKMFAEDVTFEGSVLQLDATKLKVSGIIGQINASGAEVEGMTQAQRLALSRDLIKQAGEANVDWQAILEQTGGQVTGRGLRGSTDPAFIAALQEKLYEVLNGGVETAEQAVRSGIAAALEQLGATPLQVSALSDSEIARFGTLIDHNVGGVYDQMITALLAEAGERLAGRTPVVPQVPGRTPGGHRLPNEIGDQPTSPLGGQIASLAQISEAYATFQKKLRENAFGEQDKKILGQQFLTWYAGAIAGADTTEAKLALQEQYADTVKTALHDTGQDLLMSEGALFGPILTAMFAGGADYTKDPAAKEMLRLMQSAVDSGTLTPEVEAALQKVLTDAAAGAALLSKPDFSNLGSDAMGNVIIGAETAAPITLPRFVAAMMGLTRGATPQKGTSFWQSLMNAGGLILGTIVDGMAAGERQGTERVSGILNRFIGKQLPSSPVRAGPLKHPFLFEAGRKIVGQINEGMARSSLTLPGLDGLDAGRAGTGGGRQSIHIDRLYAGGADDEPAILARLAFLSPLGS